MTDSEHWSLQCSKLLKNFGEGDSMEAEKPRFTDQWGAQYCLVEPGEFSMGTAKGSPREAPEHLVQITEPFFLGERPVTQAQWSDLMGSNPSTFQEGWSAGLRPVESISMVDIVLFLQRLNDKEHGTERLGVVGHWRLPSESEWEYAAKAGSSGRWWFGDRDSELDEYGWHAGNSGGSTREVGLKKSNPWGFHDMNGLINEWCADHWAPHFKSPRTQQPHHDSSERYVVKGGSWFTESDSTRNAARAFAAHSKKSDGLGLRLVWDPTDMARQGDEG